MGDIPEDIIKTANETWRLGSGDCKNAIAHVIMAERSRCADIAGKWASDDLQIGEVRIASAYIRREIFSGQ